MNQKPQKANILINAIKILISVAAIAFVIHYFNNNANFGSSTVEFINGLLKQNWVLPMLFFFVCLNWWLETKKWQLLLSNKEKIRTGTAIQAVFAGVTIGLFTPNRIGEYAGRLWFAKNKVFAISATVIGNISQLTITILFGILALFFYAPIQKNDFTYLNVNLLYTGLLAVLAFIILFIYRRQIWKRLSNRKITSLIQLINNARGFSKKTIVQSLLLSATRYFSFVLPFAILLSFVYQSTLFQFLWIVPLTYFFQTFVPTFAIAEVGVRSATIGIIMESINLNAEPAIIVSILIWLTNVMLPALMGLLIIWKTKINLT
jgi:uncharacterized membrane protein YbhN (UPF0104 family)